MDLRLLMKKGNTVGSVALDIVAFRRFHTIASEYGLVDELVDLVVGFRIARKELEGEPTKYSSRRPRHSLQE